MIALLAATVAATTAPALPTIEEIYARHRRAVGTFTSSTARWTGSVTSGALVDRFEVVADYTGRFRETWTSPLGTRIEGSDGRDSWTEDESGFVEQHPSAGGFSYQAEIIRMNNYLLLGQNDATVSGPVDFDGRKAYAVETNDPDQPITLFVDVRTMLLDGAQAKDRSSHYTDYKVFEGVEVPTKDVEIQNGVTFTRTVDSVEFGVPVAGRFDVPAMRDPEFPAGANDVSFTFDQPHGLIVLQTLVNGKPERMLLDSGSSTSVIDSGIASRLGLTTAGVSHIVGAGALTGTLARIDHFSVAGITLSPFVVGAVPLQLPAVIDDQNIVGVLGSDFLARMVTKIDYGAHEIDFTKISAFQYHGTGVVLPIDTADRVPRIQALFGEDGTATFTVDTGNDASLVLYEDFAKQHERALAGTFDAPMQTSSGVGGDLATSNAIVSEVGLGALIVRQVPAEIVTHPAGAFESGISSGLIGAGIFSRFRDLFLDYAGKRFIIESF